ncbi:hypothetical protein BvCms12BK_05112 [Escherichia coli]|nr:hypothetical protein BvCms12BK_05112 [Escherichia coli]
MARLSQLAGNLWIVFPPTVTIAVLFALFQQGLSLFNFTTQFFRTGTEQHPAQFFYLSPQMFYFPFIFFDLFFGTCQCRAQEGLRLFNQTQLLVFLTELAFQFCNANEVFLTHGRFYNAARRFLQHCQGVKAGCFWLTPVQLIEEHCQLRAGNGYLTVTYRRPDKLAFLQAFGEQAQTISISPKNFNGVTPSATEDKQVTGEGINI